MGERVTVWSWWIAIIFYHNTHPRAEHDPRNVALCPRCSFELCCMRLELRSLGRGAVGVAVAPARSCRGSPTCLAELVSLGSCSCSQAHTGLVGVPHVHVLPTIVLLSTAHVAYHGSMPYADRVLECPKVPRTLPLHVILQPIASALPYQRPVDGLRR